MTLQWGHGGEAVESAKDDTVPHSDGGSFNGATAVKPWNHTKGAIRRDDTLLQWGHGGEAVESRVAELATLRAQGLQWGHGGEAVESTHRAGSTA